MAAADATISGLGKREFMLRRAGKDQPEVFTTRWAMSYLRGPMTRDQIAMLTPDATPVAPAESTTAAPAATDSAAAVDTVVPTGAPAPSDVSIADDETRVMPEIASGVGVRWVDVAAPWLGDVGGDERGTVREAALVARIAIRYDDDQGRSRPRRGVRGRAVPARRSGRRVDGDQGRLRRSRSAAGRPRGRRLPVAATPRSAPRRCSPRSSAISATTSPAA